LEYKLENTMSKLDETTLHQLLLGATFLGTGGGGSYSVGKKLLEATLAVSGEVNVIQAADMPEDAIALSPAGLGSPEAATQVQGTPFSISAPRAYKALKQKLKENDTRASHVDTHYLIAGEIGPWATMITCYLAAKEQCAIIDADGGGRAIPQLNMTSYTAGGINASPISIANDGQTQEEAVVSVTDVGSTELAADVVRGIISTNSFGNTGAFVTWPMSRKQIETSAITGSTSFTQKVGALLSEQQEVPMSTQQLDKLLSVLREERGFAGVMIKGELTEISESTVGTFDFGQTTFVSTDRTLNLYNKNENMYGYFADSTTPCALAPDSICYLRDDGVPFTNADLSDQNYGQTFYIIGFSADKRMRNEHTLKVFRQTLTEMGYAGSYVPIEKLSINWNL
jgi:DUF917 family protein